MTISEVSKKYDLPADTLRYYEKVGLIPSVNRSGGGIRDYSEADLKWVEYIKCMRRAGVSIATLTRYVELFRLGDSTAQERKQLLLDERARIAANISELNETLDRLDRKIEGYDEIILKYEKQLK